MRAPDLIEMVEYRTSSHALSHDEAAELGDLTKGTSQAKDRPRVIERLTPIKGSGT